VLKPPACIFIILHLVLVIVLCFVCLRLVSCVPNICCQFLWIVNSVSLTFIKSFYLLSSNVWFSDVVHSVLLLNNLNVKVKCWLVNSWDFSDAILINTFNVLLTLFIMLISLLTYIGYICLLSHSIYYHQMFGFQMFLTTIKRLIQQQCM
jgi:hypothetical protein